jgi:hypothetical protein
MQGMNYILAFCKVHKMKCQHAVVGSFVLCVQCLVEKEVANATAQPPEPPVTGAAEHQYAGVGAE